MKDLPAHQLDPKVKTVWRINDAIWLTVVFLCCFVPFAIAAMVDPATWMFVVLVGAVKSRKSSDSVMAKFYKIRYFCTYL